MIVEVTVHGSPQRVEVQPGQPGGGALGVHLENAAAGVRLEPLAGSEWWRLEVDGVAVPVRLQAREGGTLLATVGAIRVPLNVRRWLPVRSRRSPTAGGQSRIEVRAPMPGLITATPLTSGDAVEAGGVVAIVEAMKMQMEVPAPTAGRIEEVRVRPGQEVTGGQVLIVVRASGTDNSGAADP